MDRSPKRITRTLRDRKERKLYTDDWALGEADDEIEGPQSFDLDEKLRSPRFGMEGLIREMSGSTFNLAYIQEHGFTEPILFKEPTALGIRVPAPNFSVSDVKTLVGSRRMLDVMDVRTQKNMEMTMAEWTTYYEDPAKERLLNVISLEFSRTRLEPLVEAPSVVRQLDWVERVWPRHLKKMQTEATNVMDDMMYPKVQKYCLMSVAGCFTDFHVDFGGTSVWYHILRGAKVFWLIPPTDANLNRYQEWVLSGKQGESFFGDEVEECARVYLAQGHTFFIPSGWIHAVYTPKDSLVFGGNFLHSFGIEKQLKIAAVEEQTKVPQKFRYPFFTEMLWYTLERYAHCLLGQSFIRIPQDDDDEEWKAPPPVKIQPPADVALSPAELLGLKAIVLYLHQLPIPRKNVPALIYDPVALLRSIRHIVEMHRYDDPAKAVTGIPILVWPSERPQDVGKVVAVKRSRPFKGVKKESSSGGKGSVDSGEWSDVPLPTSRRRPCGKCQACTQPSDCHQCSPCVLKAKYPDKRRGGCVMRECMAPVLSEGVLCAECREGSSAGVLMECSICLVVVHPVCIGPKANPRVVAIVSEDLPNSWECPLCLDKVPPGTLLKRRRSVSSAVDPTNAKGSNGPQTSYNDHGTSCGAQTTFIPSALLALNNNSSVHVNGNGGGVSSPTTTTTTTVVKKEPMDKSARDDVSSVRQKLDEVVRRKSTEEAAAAAAAAALVNGKGDVKGTALIAGRLSKLKRTLSGGEENGKKVEEANNNKKEEVPPKKKASPVKYPFRTELASQVMTSSGKILKKPSNVVRPAPLDDDGFATMKRNRGIWLEVFKWLDVTSLSRVLSVSKDWNAIGMDPALWTTLDISHKKMTAEVLKGVVRRQPEVLLLNWTKISRQQLHWVLARLPQLRHLSVVGVPWGSVSALKSSFTPALKGLDLGYVDNLIDGGVREILAPPADSRPGLTDSKSRLRHLTYLSLAGAHLSDVSLRYVTQHAGSITKLDLSCCPRITDAGIAQLGAPDSPALENLTHLFLSGCPQVTNISLDHLARCKRLVHLDIRDIRQLTVGGLQKFMTATSVTSQSLTVAHSLPAELVTPNTTGATINGGNAAGPSTSSSSSAAMLLGMGGHHHLNHHPHHHHHHSGVVVGGPPSGPGNNSAAASHLIGPPPPLVVSILP